MIVRGEHWQLLLSFCETNKKLVTNRFSDSDGRAKANALWQNVASKLNSLGFGEKSVEGWRKALTDWKSKTKAKAAALKRDQNKTGGGLPEVPPLSTLEEKLLEIIEIMGTTALDGNDMIPELGFEKMEILQKTDGNRKIIDTERTNDVEITPHSSRDHNYYDLASGGSSITIGITNKPTKRKLEYEEQPRKHVLKRKHFINTSMTKQLLNVDNELIQLLKEIDKNTERVATSLESIASSLSILDQKIVNQSE